MPSHVPEVLSEPVSQAVSCFTDAQGRAGYAVNNATRSAGRSASDVIRMMMVACEEGGFGEVEESVVTWVRAGECTRLRGRVNCGPRCYAE